MTTTDTTLMADWQPITAELPQDKIAVETKIDDGKGERNVAKLVRQGRLWFFPDMSMYVYYQPTHWRATDARQQEQEEV